MIYTILAAHFADPLPPLSRFTGLADLNFTRVQRICLGFAYMWGIYLFISSGKDSGLFEGVILAIQSMQDMLAAMQETRSDGHL